MIFEDAKNLQQSKIKNEDTREFRSSLPLLKGGMAVYVDDQLFKTKARVWLCL